jgi:hypothetical protein
MEGLWGFVIIGGPIILLAALIAGWVLNRRSKVPVEVTEAATARRKREEHADEDGQNLR